jgi:hypothetical protein
MSKSGPALLPPPGNSYRASVLKPKKLKGYYGGVGTEQLGISQSRGTGWEDNESVRRCRVIKRMAVASLTVLVASMGTTCLAKKEHAPLPQKILAAKTMYIENHASAKDADRAYDEFKKWGRWQIVEDRAKADLVLVLSAQEGQSSSGTTATYDPTPAPSMGGAGTWKYGTTHSESDGSAHLELVEEKTGQTLYADTKGTMRRTIRELRKRIEEQEKAPNKKQ